MRACFFQMLECKFLSSKIWPLCETPGQNSHSSTISSPRTVSSPSPTSRLSYPCARNTMTTCLGALRTSSQRSGTAKRRFLSHRLRFPRAPSNLGRCFQGTLTPMKRATSPRETWLLPLAGNPGYRLHSPAVSMAGSSILLCTRPPSPGS